VVYSPCLASPTPFVLTRRFAPRHGLSGRFWRAAAPLANNNFNAQLVQLIESNPNYSTILLFPRKSKLFITQGENQYFICACANIPKRKREREGGKIILSCLKRSTASILFFIKQFCCLVCSFQKILFTSTWISTCIYIYIYIYHSSDICRGIKGRNQ